MFQVGLLDVDLCGPSIPYLLGLENQEVHQCEDGWVPIYFDQEQKLAVMSIGFLLKSRNDSVVWRGPKKTGKDYENQVGLYNYLCYVNSFYYLVSPSSEELTIHLFNFMDKDCFSFSILTLKFEKHP